MAGGFVRFDDTLDGVWSQETVILRAVTWIGMTAFVIVDGGSTSMLTCHLSRRVITNLTWKHSNDKSLLPVSVDADALTRSLNCGRNNRFSLLDRLCQHVHQICAEMIACDGRDVLETNDIDNRPFECVKDTLKKNIDTTFIVHHSAVLHDEHISVIRYGLHLAVQSAGKVFFHRFVRKVSHLYVNFDGDTHLQCQQFVRTRNRYSRSQTVSFHEMTHNLGDTLPIPSCELLYDEAHQHYRCDSDGKGYTRRGSVHQAHEQFVPENNVKCDLENESILQQSSRKK